jgi:hypothetical protein
MVAREGWNEQVWTVFSRDLSRTVRRAVARLPPDCFGGALLAAVIALLNRFVDASVIVALDAILIQTKDLAIWVQSKTLLPADHFPYYILHVVFLAKNQVVSKSKENRIIADSIPLLQGNTGPNPQLELSMQG